MNNCPDCESHNVGRQNALLFLYEEPETNSVIEVVELTVMCRECGCEWQYDYVVEDEQQSIERVG